MDEYLDVLNEKGEIIGKELKSICKQKKLWYKSAGILVFTDKTYEKIILQKRAKNKKHHPNKLCIPGGHTSSGETHFESAKREYFEEMYNKKTQNKKINFEELFETKTFYDDEGHSIVKIYRVIDNGPFNIQKSEVDKLVIMTLKNAINLAKNKPDEFNKTSSQMLKEYEKRFLK